MADHTPTGSLEMGAKMDYAEHDRTYSVFLTLAKFGALVVAALLLTMAFYFFASGGGSGGVIAALILFGAILGIGGYVLR